MSNADDFQRHLHGVDPKRRPGAYLVVTRELVIQKDSFSLHYTYEIYGHVIGEVESSRRRVHKWILCVRSQAMKAAGQKMTISLSKKRLVKNLSDGKESNEYDNKIVEVPVTSSVDAMSVKKHTAVSVLFFNRSYFHHADFIMRIKQVNETDNPLGDVSFSNVTSLHASFGMYGFDHLSGPPSVTFHPEESARNITTFLTGGRKTDFNSLSNAAKLALLTK